MKRCVCVCVCVCERKRERVSDRGGQSGRRAHLSGTVTPHKSHCQTERSGWKNRDRRARTHQRQTRQNDKRQRRREKNFFLHFLDFSKLKLELIKTHLRTNYNI